MRGLILSHANRHSECDVVRRPCFAGGDIDRLCREVTTGSSLDPVLRRSSSQDHIQILSL